MKHLLLISLPATRWGGFDTFDALDNAWLEAFGRDYLFVCQDSHARQIRVYCLTDWPDQARSTAERILAQRQITPLAPLRLQPWPEGEQLDSWLLSFDNLQRILWGLKCVQEEGGAGNFITFSNRRDDHYFVQFAAEKDETRLYAEVAENSVLPPPLQLSDSQMRQLEALGWTLPGPDGMNASRQCRAATDSDRLAIAQDVRRVFEEIYRADFYQPLIVNLVLE